MWAKEAIMEKNKKRGIRRFHDARMQKRAEQVIRDRHYWGGDMPSPEEIRDQARKRRDHMCVCSCSGCGNPRNDVWSGRRERMTRPEWRAEDAFYAQLEDYMTVDPNNDEE